MDINYLRNITEKAILEKNIEDENIDGTIDSNLKSIYQKMLKAANEGRYQIDDYHENICSDQTSLMIYNILIEKGYKVIYNPERKYVYGSIELISWK